MNNTIKAILIQEGEPSPNNPVEIKKLLVNEEAEKYINDLKKENQQLKKERASIMTSLTTSREKYNNDKARYRRKYKNLKKQKDDVIECLKKE